MGDKKIDILLWGATGYIGILAARHAAAKYGNSQEKLRFALGGRSREKLEQLRTQLTDLYAQAKEWPIITGDSLNQEEMDAVVSQTRVVAALVGPYAQLGDSIVDACVRLGVDYVDVTGEIDWIKDVIEKYHTTAVRNNVLIVNACGFDSVSADLCAMLVETTVREILQREVDYMYCGVGDLKGGVSGGTIASAAYAIQNPKRVREISQNPFSLTPGDPPRQLNVRDADQSVIQWIPELRKWTIPFFLSPKNARTVYRSMVLRNVSYAYREGKLVSNFFSGFMSWMLNTFGLLLFILPFTRSLLLRALPQPGQGPSLDLVDTGYYSLHTVGVCKRLSTDEKPRQVHARMSGKIDPHGATGQFVIESAVILALHKKDIVNELKGGGVLTPSTALGKRLVERLQQNTDVHFEIRVE